MVTRSSSQKFAADDRNAVLHCIQEHMNICNQNLQKLHSQLDEDYPASTYDKTASAEAPSPAAVPRPSGFLADTGSTPIVTDTPPGGNRSTHSTPKGGGRPFNTPDLPIIEDLKGLGGALSNSLSGRGNEKVVAVLDAESNLLYSSGHVYAPIAEVRGGKAYLQNSEPPAFVELEAALEAVVAERQAGGSVEATAAVPQSFAAVEPRANSLIEPAADWSSVKPYPPVVKHDVDGKALLPATEKVSGAIGAGRRSSGRTSMLKTGAPPPSTSGAATPARTRESRTTQQPQAKGRARAAPIEVPVQSLGRNSPLRQSSSTSGKHSANASASLSGSTRSLRSCSSAAASLAPSAGSTTAGSATPVSPTVARSSGRGNVSKAANGGTSSAGSSHVSASGTGGTRPQASRGEAPSARSTSTRSEASTCHIATRMVTSPSCIGASRDTTPRVVRSYSSNACGLPAVATPGSPAPGSSRAQSPPRARSPARAHSPMRAQSPSRAQSPLANRSGRRSGVQSPGRAPMGSAIDIAHRGEQSHRPHSPMRSFIPQPQSRQGTPQPQSRQRAPSRSPSPALPMSPLPAPGADASGRCHIASSPSSPLPAFAAMPGMSGYWSPPAHGLPPPGIAARQQMGSSPLPSPEQRTRGTHGRGSPPGSPLPADRHRSTSPPPPASAWAGPPLHVPHGTQPGPACDPNFLRHSFPGQNCSMDHAASMPNLAVPAGCVSPLGSMGLPPAPIPMKSQNLWEVEDYSVAAGINSMQAPPPPPPPPQPVPWAPTPTQMHAHGAIAQDHPLIGPFHPWAPLRGGGPVGWPGPCGNMTPPPPGASPPGSFWSPSFGTDGSSPSSLVHYDPGASSRNGASKTAHERGGQRSRKLDEERRSQTPKKTQEPSWAPVVETPWAPVVRIGESMVCSSSAGEIERPTGRPKARIGESMVCSSSVGGIEKSELEGGSLTSTNSNLQDSSNVFDVGFTSRCSPESLAKPPPKRGAESPRGGSLYPQTAAQSFDDGPDTTWLRPPFGAHHQVSG